MMVPFAGFVVETQDANAIHDKCQTILVSVRAATHGLWHLPDHDFSETILSEDQPFPQQHSGPHVGFYTNTIRRVKP
jgi:hypothetical protein